MHFHIITLFPKSFDSYLKESILGRAIKGIKPRRKVGAPTESSGKIKVSFYNPRDFANNKNKRIDRAPYGGGPGMVIQAEPVIKAIAKAMARIKTKESRIRKNPNSKSKIPRSKIIWLNPSGKQFSNSTANNISKKYTDIVIVCGRYEGIDARVKKVFKVDEVSVGPFVLTGGELPAMVIMDTISRQIKGVLGNYDSLEERRIASRDTYTRPEVFSYKGKKYKVPKILLSGHRAKIEEWKKGKK